MSESLAALLSRREPMEAPEIKIIQDFVNERFNIVPKVSIAPKSIVIGVKSSSLAGALRPLLPQITEACDTDKRLLIRIQ